MRIVSIAPDSSIYSEADLGAIIAAAGGLRDTSQRDDLREDLAGAISSAKIYTFVQDAATVRLNPKDFEVVARAAARLLRHLGVADDGDPRQAKDALKIGLSREGKAHAIQFHAVRLIERRLAAIRAETAEHAETPTADLQEIGAHSVAEKGADQARQSKRERLMRLHGGWPSEATSGYLGMDFEAGLAIVRAIEGVQRLRTWAELAARALRGSQTAGQPSEMQVKLSANRAESTILVGRLAEVYPRHFKGSFGISKRRREGSGHELYGPGIRYIQACLKPLGRRMSPAAIEKAWDAYRADRRMGGKGAK